MKTPALVWVAALATAAGGAAFAWRHIELGDRGLAAADAAALPPLPEGYAADTERLRPLGDVYARHYGVTLRRVSLGPAETIEDPREAAARLDTALLIAYLPTPGVLITFPAAEAAELMTVHMTGDRSPGEVVRGVAVAGNLLVPVLWEFAEGAPARTYAVFSPGQELLFESLLSMPAVQGRVFSLGH